MRTTVLKLTMVLAVLGGTLIAQADDEQGHISGQSPEVWQEVPAEDGSEPYSDISPDAPSWIRPRYWFLPPKFGAYFQADVLFLERFHGAFDQPIAVNESLESPVVMSTNNASLTNKWAAGMMYTFGFNLDQIAQIEATYWGLNSWSNSATVTNPADPFGHLGLAGTLQTVTADYQLADQMSINYSSKINNVELNYKQTINGVTLLTGPRYFRMTETFNISSHGTGGLAPETSDYNVSTVNNLIGWQFGTGYLYERGPLNIGLLGKIGPYMNAVHQSTLLQDVGNTVTLRDYNKDGMPVSVVAETQLNITWRVTDCFAIHGGYRFLWIQNVAYAPNQLDLSDSPPGTHVLDAHSYMLLQGLSVGGELRW